MVVSIRRVGFRRGRSLVGDGLSDGDLVEITVS